MVGTEGSIGNGLKIPNLMQKSKPTPANRKIRRFSDTKTAPLKVCDNMLPASNSIGGPPASVARPALKFQRKT